MLGDEENMEAATEKVENLEELLGSRLAQFLDTNYRYTLSQISSSIRPHLYKGPSTSSENEEQPNGW